MLSNLVKAALGDILDIVDQLAPWRNELIEMYKAYKNPLFFINNYLRNFPTSSRSIAGQIYRAIRYLADQGPVLQLQGYDVPLDRRLAGNIPTPPDRPLLDYSFRYNIEFRVSAPGVGQAHTFNFWVNSTGLLSEREVAEMAIPALINLIDRYRLTLNSGEINSATITSTGIKDFVQYIPR
jgi:hypothetical protein